MTNQVRTVLAARKIRKRFLAHFMKLDTFSEFIPKLKAAMEKAKEDLLKIKDEALAKAARIVATSVAEVNFNTTTPYSKYT